MTNFITQARFILEELEQSHRDGKASIAQAFEAAYHLPAPDKYVEMIYGFNPEFADVYGGEWMVDEFVLDDNVTALLKALTEHPIQFKSSAEKYYMKKDLLADPYIRVDLDMSNDTDAEVADKMSQILHTFWIDRLELSEPRLVLLQEIMFLALQTNTSPERFKEITSETSNPNDIKTMLTSKEAPLDQEKQVKVREELLERGKRSMSLLVPTLESLKPVFDQAIPNWESLFTKISELTDKIQNSYIDSETGQKVTSTISPDGTQTQTFFDKKKAESNRRVLFLQLVISVYKTLQTYHKTILKLQLDVNKTLGLPPSLGTTVLNQTFENMFSPLRDILQDAKADPTGIKKGNLGDVINLRDPNTVKDFNSTGIASIGWLKEELSAFFNSRLETTKIDFANLVKYHVFQRDTTTPSSLHRKLSQILLTIRVFGATGSFPDAMVDFVNSISKLIGAEIVSKPVTNSSVNSSITMGLLSELEDSLLNDRNQSRNLAGN